MIGYSYMYSFWWFYNFPRKNGVALISTYNLNHLQFVMIICWVINYRRATFPLVDNGNKNKIHDFHTSPTATIILTNIRAIQVSSGRIVFSNSRELKRWKVIIHLEVHQMMIESFSGSSGGHHECCGRSHQLSQLGMP